MKFNTIDFYDNSFNEFLLLLVLIIGIGIPLYSRTGQNKVLSLYLSSNSLYQIFARNALLISFIYFLNFYLRFEFLDIQFSILLWISLSTLTCITKVMIKDILRYIKSLEFKNYKSVVIYGAGSAGAQLAAQLRNSTEYKVKFFIDDSEYLLDRRIYNIPIFSPDILKKGYFKIDEILLAIPSLTINERSTILEKLSPYQIKVLQIPSIEELSRGNKKIDSFRPVKIEDLLGRKIVRPKTSLLKNAISNGVVCVTGAGGSIGSELSRQILKLSPKKLILLEQNEFNLYSIKNQMDKLNHKKLTIITALGSANDKNFLKKLLSFHKVNIIFHAAAYKHVPLVEENPLQGILNNVFSTKTICDVAIHLNIQKVILISSDKAVRPTNVMGATKRLSEIIFLYYDSKKLGLTKFSMVRFGNVLGSSGSVIPLFQKQIDEGGPLTLTHPKVNRYFMTIPEAAELVLQSAAISKGGEIFLLDMGKPVLIKSLAEKLIKLNGKTIIDKNNPEGDIEIVDVGLRPGEKLYEELLIDGEASQTINPLIFKANEKFSMLLDFEKKLDELLDAVKSQNKSKSLEILKFMVK
ncbi:nucleoside-diphosphate sugar epimerase/dehydratase [uncultured Prochlorococcus sp.]|uniref:polysaccharide biosynthesis protein n=1 Tax=uncultured Prochlorococcus sp. TaxID=159733 RepID=UPI00258DB649|nr:nucleoside-diphosphate sugar epimerase/dehydratase [uncultured Prochlorococcus sp.]